MKWQKTKKFFFPIILAGLPILALLATPFLPWAHNAALFWGIPFVVLWTLGIVPLSVVCLHIIDTQFFHPSPREVSQSASNDSESEQ